MKTENWDDLEKCANFIEMFTSHNINDAEHFKLEDFSRKDLEGVIHLLHGYYTHYFVNGSQELRETLKCTSEDVIDVMMISSEIDIDENGEIILGDQLWELVKKNPTLLKLLISAQMS